MDESARRSLNNSRDYFLAFLNQAIFEIGVDFDGPILPPLVATSLLVRSTLGLLAKSLAFVAAFAAADLALVAAAFALAGAFLAADFALVAACLVALEALSTFLAAAAIFLAKAA